MLLNVNGIICYYVALHASSGSQTGFQTCTDILPQPCAYVYGQVIKDESAFSP